MAHRQRALPPAVAAALAAWFWLAPTARAADEAPARYYVGVGYCVECHELGRKQKGGPPIVCTCEEADKWLCKDKHQDAYNVLDAKNNPRAKRMAEILGYDPQHKAECLSCHSTPGVNEEKKPDPPYGESFRMQDGVGCVACHGAYDKWLDLHGGAMRAKWRQNSRADKEAKFGMTDLWDPVRRADACGSCHIGNKAETKVVTHEMYAAGHPSLSGFEIGALCERMPRHWQLLAQKDDAARGLLAAKPGEMEQTRLVVVGAAASFRQAMQLLAEEAREAVKEGNALDFAQMDCAGCHHDLRQPSWRQARGYPGRPGRPSQRAWPLALLPIAVDFAGDAEEQKQCALDLQTKLMRLTGAFDARPYGDPKDIAEAAEDLKGWANRLLDKIKADATQYNQSAAVKVLRRLARLPAEHSPDYDTARQAAWAFVAVYDEVLRTSSKAEDADAGKALELLKQNAAQFQPHLKALDEQLDLNMPATDADTGMAVLPTDDQARKDKLAECAMARQAAYDAYVPAVLTKTADYNPDAVKKAFAELAKLLP